MLTKVTVLADEMIELPLIGATPKDRYILQKITGLNPPEIDLFVGDYARDGGVYAGRRVNNRPVGLTITPNPSYANHDTVASVRQHLHKAFSEPLAYSEATRLLLHDDLGQGEKVIEGYVENFEGEVFDKDPTVDISVLCPDPFIRDAFSTDHYTDMWTAHTFPYFGTAPTGIKLDLLVTSDTNTIVVGLNLDSNRYNIFELDLSRVGGFLEGDKVRIRTEYGKRSVTLVRGTEETSLLAFITPRSRWIQARGRELSFNIGRLVPGDEAVASGTYVSYSAAYWGI